MQQIRASKEVSDRLQLSYGFWTFMATMMWPTRFLQMQALNRYIYRVGVCRVQTRFAFPRRPLIPLALKQPRN